MAKQKRQKKASVSTNEFYLPSTEVQNLLTSLQERADELGYSDFEISFVGIQPKVDLKANCHREWRCRWVNTPTGPVERCGYVTVCE